MMFLPIKCLCLLLAFLTVVQGLHGSQEEEASSKHLRGDNDRQLAPESKNGRKKKTLKTYIVVYKESDVATAEMTDNTTLTMVEEVGGEVKHKYDTVLNGMAVTLTPDAAMLLQQDENIDYIVEDSPVYITTTWGMDRVDQPNLPLDKTYKWEGNMNSGSRVNVCVSNGMAAEECTSGFVAQI
jgi:hypothetical protein